MCICGRCSDLDSILSDYDGGGLQAQGRVGGCLVGVGILTPYYLILMGGLLAQGRVCVCMYVRVSGRCRDQDSILSDSDGGGGGSKPKEGGGVVCASVSGGCSDLDSILSDSDGGTPSLR